MSLLTLILVIAALAVGLSLGAWLPRHAGLRVTGVEALFRSMSTSPKLTARDRAEIAARLWAP